MEFTEFKRVLTQFLKATLWIHTPRWFPHTCAPPIGSPNAGNLVPPSKYPKLKVPPKFLKFAKVPPKFPKFAKVPQSSFKFRF